MKTSCECCIVCGVLITGSECAPVVYWAPRLCEQETHLKEIKKITSTVKDTQTIWYY